jgi:hypothetical protein
MIGSLNPKKFIITLGVQESSVSPDPLKSPVPKSDHRNRISTNCQRIQRLPQWPESLGSLRSQCLPWLLLSDRFLEFPSIKDPLKSRHQRATPKIVAPPTSNELRDSTSDWSSGTVIDSRVIELLIV